MRPFAKPVFRTWKEQAKEIVVLQQPAKAAPPEIRRIVVPPPVPAEANEPGAWIEQAQAQTAAATKIAIARTDDQPSVRASADTIWKQALRSPDAARTAIILREIFGPPRGVQSSNFVFERLSDGLRHGCGMRGGRFHRVASRIYSRLSSRFFRSLIPSPPAWRNWQTRWTQKCIYAVFTRSLFASQHQPFYEGR